MSPGEEGCGWCAGGRPCVLGVLHGWGGGDVGRGRLRVQGVCACVSTDGGWDAQVGGCDVGGLERSMDHSAKGLVLLWVQQLQREGLEGD